MIPIKKTQTGFALLITLLMISVVIAVVLSIIELSLKQLELSVNSTDSEIAFQAANAGMECIHRARRISSSTIEQTSPGDLTLNCFDTSETFTADTSSIAKSGAGNVVRYKGEIDWGSGTDARCSQIDMIVIMADTGVTIIGEPGPKSLKLIIPNYTSDSKTCPQGARCTIASVAGYSAECSEKNKLSTLKREILLEF